MATSKFRSYPPFETPASLTPYSIRPVLPVHPPPAHLLLSKPALPTPQRTPGFSGSAALNYTLSTHLIPSCYLRTTPYIPEYQTLGPKTTKQERQEWAKNVNDRFKKRAKEDGKTGFEQPAVLWNCLNRYVRKGLEGNGGGVTLFFAHATGFPKEIWEPTINHLLNSHSGPVIDEIWTWEAIQHGDACLVNEATLGCNFDWSDNSRDILNFLLHFLPSSPSASPLPTHLSQIPAPETSHRKSHGFKYRQLLCVGHSFGGCSTALAALTYPNLFSSLILVDPIIVKPPYSPETQASAQAHVNTLVLGALVRRDAWPSQEAALEALSKSPFFGAWDKDALRAYVEGGTYVTDSEGNGQAQARLKTSGLQEAVVFAENHTRAEVYAQVPNLDERIKLRWVMPGTPGAPGAEEFGPPGAARERVWLRPKNAGNVRVMGAGHLIPQEKPELLAEYLAGFVEENYRTLDTPKAML